MLRNALFSFTAVYDAVICTLMPMDKLKINLIYLFLRDCAAVLGGGFSLRADLGGTR